MSVAVILQPQKRGVLNSQSKNRTHFSIEGFVLSLLYFLLEIGPYFVWQGGSGPPQKVPARPCRFLSWTLESVVLLGTETGGVCRAALKPAQIMEGASAKSTHVCLPRPPTKGSEGREGPLTGFCSFLFHF